MPMHQYVGHPPGDRRVVHPLVDQRRIARPASPLDDVRNDDRIARRPRKRRAARFRLTSSGSIESSQSLVPVAINDFKDILAIPFDRPRPRGDA